MTVRYMCDEETCTSAVTRQRAQAAYRAALDNGWDLIRGQRCRDHRKYKLCTVCNREMRPYDSVLKTHPGTVPRGNEGTCATCTDNNRRGSTMLALLDRAVDRYLNIRTPQFATMYENPDLEAARKQAPKDVWSTLAL